MDFDYEKILKQVRFAAAKRTVEDSLPRWEEAVEDALDEIGITATVTIHVDIEDAEEPKVSLYTQLALYELLMQNQKPKGTGRVNVDKLWDKFFEGIFDDKEKDH